MKKTFDLWDKETKSSITVEATKRGKEWMAHCPKHDDQHESLAINEEKEVYLCHGCHWKGSFYKPSKRKQSLATKKVIATYGYQDEAGNLLFQVLRYEPKEFRVRRLDGKGGWIWNIEGLDSVPYLLPDLLKGNGPIFIVEGEKDADNLRSLGLVATTNPFGAGKWKPSYNRYLKGRELIIVPDNDHPGNAHAENTAKSLLGIAKSIKIVRLPNLPDGGDVTDYVNAGGSKEHLQKLIEETMLFDPGIETYDDGALCHESTEISNGIETLHDLLSKEITPRDSIIGDGLIARKDFDIFSGPQKKGKSLLSLNLAIRVAQGQPWLGFEIESPRRVGIVQQEVSEESLKTRLEKMLMGIEEREFLQNIPHLTCRGLKLDSAEGVGELHRWLDFAKVDLLIIDPLYQFHNGRENDPGDMSKVCQCLQAIAQGYNCGVLLIHHHGKPSQIEREGGDLHRGTSLLRDATDGNWTLTRVPQNKFQIAGPPSRYTLLSFEQRHTLNPDPLLLCLNPETLWFEVEEAPDRQEVKGGEVVACLREHGGEMPSEDLIVSLMARLTMGERACRQGIYTARDDGKIIAGKGKGPGHKRTWKLSDNLALGALPNQPRC